MQRLTYIRKWKEFVDRNKVLVLTVSYTANFLSELFKDGASNSTANIAKSAVSAYKNPDSDHTLGSHPVICRLMRGVFDQRPALPKYLETWDVNFVVEHVGETEKFSLKELPLRTVILVALISGR